MIRFFDVAISLVGLIVGFPVLLILYIFGLLDTGSPLFRQVRIGRGKKRFMLVKFRTMKRGTASVSTHMVKGSCITKWGLFLRKTKLDELPQLWNVLKGEMSMVGPRPCLPNQIELILEREQREIFDARPGITGLAQINAIDMSTPALLAKTDEQMLSSLCASNYFKYIMLTITGRGQGDRVQY